MGGSGRDDECRLADRDLAEPVADGEGYLGERRGDLVGEPGQHLRGGGVDLVLQRLDRATTVVIADRADEQDLGPMGVAPDQREQRLGLERLVGDLGVDDTHHVRVSAVAPLRLLTAFAATPPSDPRTWRPRGPR